MTSATTPVDHQATALAIELWPIDRLRPYDRNPRTISDDAIAKVAASIEQFGWRQPIVVDHDGIIVVGHTRWRAAKVLGRDQVPVHVAADLSPEQAKAYRLADNRAGELTGWDAGLLQLEVNDLQGFGVDLANVGFSADELQTLVPGATGPVEGEEAAPRGQLLDLIEVAIGEPKHKVDTGDHFRLGGRHHLLCVGVMTDWAKWAPLLQDGAIFCPYPGPFVAYGAKADEHVLVMVQPDPYTTGHILDRYAEIHGKRAVRKVAS